MTDTPEFFTTDGVRDEPASWDALAERIAARTLRGTNRGGFAWFAGSRAGLVAAALLLVAALASFVASTDQTVPSESEWARAFAPADDVGRAIVAVDEPPAIASLVFDTPRPERGR